MPPALTIPDPEKYKLAAGQTLPTSYTLPDYNKDGVIVKIHLVHQAKEPTFSEVSDTKTVTETIHYQYPNGDKAGADYKAVITFTRKGSKNDTTGTVNWGPWQQADSYLFPAVSTPHIKGYTPNMKQVAAQKVTPDSSNIEFTVVYHKDKKAKPDQKPHGKPQTPAKGGNFKPGKVLPTDTITGPHGEVYFKNGYYTRLGKHYLPQTGAHENMLAIFWGGLASSIGLFGLAGKRKKTDEE